MSTRVNILSSRTEWQSESRLAEANPDQFWLDQTRALLAWSHPPSKGCEGDFRSVKEKPITWFEDGRLNITNTCIDRHAENQPEKTAIIWVGDDESEERIISFAELKELVCRAANSFERLGVVQGDRVIIYMGMVPEVAIAMLACARIGAVHSVVFGGFSASAIAERIEDCGARFVITQDFGHRGGKRISLKDTVDEALALHPVEKVVVLKRQLERDTRLGPNEFDWHSLMLESSSNHTAVVLPSEAPLFILYTSGSTGRPKGVLHTCAGYLTYAMYTHRHVFGIDETDVFACVADVGWITGHSYIVYGPLGNGTTTLMFESTPVYPTPGRYWSLVQKYRVNVLYTAPTALRTLAAAGDQWVTQYDLSSLRCLGTVGEPIDPNTWQWYHTVPGESRCPIIDTWWQTETGGICIAPANGLISPPPGTAGWPLPGITPLLVDESGQPLESRGDAGHLCIKYPWPGQARTVYGDHTRFFDTYFSQYPGHYFTGDGAIVDGHDQIKIVGRVDDVLNVSGHRIGTAELESTIIEVEGISEVAVVGLPHEIKGEGICAFVCSSLSPDSLLTQINQALRASIGAHAKLDELYRISALPKTRSGKCMRRVLRRLALDPRASLGDLSTLADPAVVEDIRRDLSRI